MFARIVGGAANDPLVFTIAPKEGPYYCLLLLESITSAFTFKALLRHYAKWVLIHIK